LAEEEADATAFADQIEADADVELTEWALPYWAAWHSLATERPFGAMGGAGRIPWSAIDRYADKSGFETDHLSRMLWAMDVVFLEWLAEKQKTESTKPDAG
jgi:hypothetical protein